MISRNDPCWCGSGKKWKKCHYPEKPKESFRDRAAHYYRQYEILLKTPEQIEGIRHACKITKKILRAVCDAAKEGVTTEELDQLARKLHEEHSAIPAPLNYGDPPYPKAICTSINDVICHGIPDNKPLKNGDIMNIDVSCIINGYFGDCSEMVCIGEVPEERQLVVDTAYDCLMKSIEILRPGLMLYEIANVIEEHARDNNCSVVHQFVGHGVGINFHEAPQVPHHYNRMMIPLEEGMTFTIEPMINAGKPDGYIEKENGWIARTVDGKPSAQWEHTILITSSGHEILTVVD
ncbi:MAG: methionyl aminopeptidase [Simkaniaceae bacterium]|nr:methionyl aminopeptidase [Simkaniaceae bacterium]